MARLLAKGIAWFFRAIGVIFDLKELSVLLGGSGGTAVIVGVIAFLKETPIWLITLIVIALAILFITLLLLILGKRRTYYDNIRRVARILHNMHERAKALVFGKGEKMVGKKIEENKEIGYAIANIMGIQNKQLGSFSDANKKLGKRKEKVILNSIAKSHIAESTQSLSKIATIMEQYGIGLKQLCDRDFRYNYYKEQLSNL